MFGLTEIDALFPTNSFDDELLAELTPLTEEELGAKFDELTELAINQPDDDVALNGLRQLVSEVRNRGQIDMAMQMSMTLGAMACLHPHLGSVADEIAGYNRLHDDADDDSGHKRTDKKKGKKDAPGRPSITSRAKHWPLSKSFIASTPAKSGIMNSK